MKGVRGIIYKDIRKEGRKGAWHEERQPRVKKRLYQPLYVLWGSHTSLGHQHAVFAPLHLVQSMPPHLFCCGWTIAAHYLHTPARARLLHISAARCRATLSTRLPRYTHTTMANIISDNEEGGRAVLQIIKKKKEEEKKKRPHAGRKGKRADVASHGQADILRRRKQWWTDGTALYQGRRTDIASLMHCRNSVARATPAAGLAHQHHQR